jgi:hypothetical protein
MNVPSTSAERGSDFIDGFFSQSMETGLRKLREPQPRSRAEKEMPENGEEVNSSNHHLAVPSNEIGRNFLNERRR